MASSRYTTRMRTSVFKQYVALWVVWAAMLVCTPVIAAFGIFQTATPTIGACTTNGSDGFAGAPAGSPQFPTLLSGYTAIPSWCVAGVGYAVGFATAPAKIPGVTSPPSGMTCVSGTHTCTTDNSGVTVDGWDFSGGGGWALAIGNGTTVKNSNFLVGTNALPPLSSGGNAITGFTIINNVIDGAGIQTSPNVGVTEIFASGTGIIEYNYIKNAFAVLVQGGATAAGTSLTIKYNILANAGQGAQCCAQHGDLLQLFGNGSFPAGVFSTLMVDYNLLLANASTAAGQGLSVLSAAGNTNNSATSLDASNNTAIITQAFGGGIANGFAILDTTWLNGSGTMNNNFIDCTACFPSTTSWAFVGQLNGCGTATTNASTAAGNAVVHFSNVNTFSQFGSCGSINTTNPVQGGVTVVATSFVWDLTTPTAIAPPTSSTATFSQSSNTTSITMNVNAIGPGIGSGDLIRSGDGPYSGTVSCGTTNTNMLTGAALTLAAC